MDTAREEVITTVEYASSEATTLCATTEILDVDARLGIYSESGTRVADDFLIANRSFRMGEAILAAPPFLIEPSLNSNRNAMERELARFAKRRCVDVSWLARLYAFVRASDENRNKFWNLRKPDLGAGDRHGGVEKAREIALTVETSENEDCLNVFDEMDQTAMVVVMITWEANAVVYHKTTALFQFSGILRHTCEDPHMVYAPPAEGKTEGRFLANRPIDEGEVLTINFCMPWQWMSTPARTLMLESKRFLTCNCQRCTFDVDTCRGLRCPDCWVRWKEQRKVSGEDGENGAGYIYLEMRKARAGHPTPWECARCGKEFPDDEHSLFVVSFWDPKDLTIERAMEDLLADYTTLDEADRLVIKSEELERQWKRCRDLLSPRHWTTNCFIILYVKALAREVRIQASKGREIVKQCQKIQNCCDSLWEWMTNRAFQDPLDALFTLHHKVALQLADACKDVTADDQSAQTAAAVAIRLAEKLQPIVLGCRPQWSLDGTIERDFDKIVGKCNGVLTAKQQQQPGSGLLRAVLVRDNAHKFMTTLDLGRVMDIETLRRQDGMGDWENLSPNLNSPRDDRDECEWLQGVLIPGKSNGKDKDKPRQKSKNVKGKKGKGKKRK